MVIGTKVEFHTGQHATEKIGKEVNPMGRHHGKYDSVACGGLESSFSSEYLDIELGFYQQTEQGAERSGLEFVTEQAVNSKIALSFSEMGA